MPTPATITARQAASSTQDAGAVTLSTTFSPAASCGDIYLSAGVLSLGGPEATSISSCFPSGWETGTTQYFTATSPVCPQGYSMNTVNTIAIGTLTATTGTCCPSDYSIFTGSAFFSGERCTSEITRPDNITVTTEGNAGIGYTTTVLPVRSGDGLNAYGVAIQWQTAASTTTSSSLTSSTTSASPASSTLTSSPTSTTSSASSGLSTGAKAGVGVGVALGALLIIAGLAAFFFRRRKAKHETNVVSPAGAGYGGYNDGTSELDTERKSPGQQSAKAIYGGPPVAHPQQGQYVPIPQGSPQSTGAIPAQQPHWENQWQQPGQQHELAGGHEMHELDGDVRPRP